MNFNASFFYMHDKEVKKPNGILIIITQLIKTVIARDVI